MEGPQIHWTGEARWLTFAAALLLFVIGVILVRVNAASAGWNIFLGLLLFGSVASGYHRAPRTVKGVAILVSVRLVIALLVQSIFDIVVSTAVLVALGFALRDFKRQASQFASDQAQPWQI